MPMARELDLRLTATPTVELPNVGLGNLSSLSDAERSIVHELASVAVRRTLAADSKAMPDGSFPIRNVPDLKKAVQAYGRAKNKPRVRRFIVRRARGLGRTDLLPETWGVRTPPAAVLAAGEGGPQNGIMVALYPPPEMAAQLAGGQPGDLPPDDLHVTLAYLGTTDDVTPEQLAAAREAIGNVANTQTPFPAQVQGVGTFLAPESDDPQWYSVDAPGLAALRTRVVQALESVGVQPRVEHDFTPHMTVRYGGEQPVVPEGGEQPWDVHGLVVKAGPDAEVHTFGHDFLSDAGDDDDAGGGGCLLCGTDSDDEVHQAGPPPAWMDALDNPALAGGQRAEFVAAPGPCSLDRSPKHNWVEKSGGLPNYICQVARAIARGGKSLESAIPIAIGTMKHWAAGGTHNGKKVSAAVQARAAAAVAEWEAKKAKAHTSAGATVPLAPLTGPSALELEVTDAQFGTTGPATAYKYDENNSTPQYQVFWKHYGATGGGLSAVSKSPVVHPATTTKEAPVPTSPSTAVAASAAEFAWNPDIHPADKHGRPIAKGHKVASATGEPGTVVGNAPARGKQVVQVSVPKGSPVSVPAAETEVLSPPEQPGALNDVELKDRHAKISADIAGHHDAQAADAKAQSDDPTATVADDVHQPEIDRLKVKRKPYADEIVKRAGANSLNTDDVDIDTDIEMGDFGFRFKHGWIPLGGGKSKAEKEADRVTRYNAHKKETAGKDAARAERYAAHKKETAGKDAATAERYAAHQIKLAQHAKAQGVQRAVASAAGDPDAADYSYHWNPDTEETFRISEDGNIAVFAPALDEQEQPSWQAIDTYNGATHADDVSHLPRIEDPATLEAILGAALALIADGSPAAPAVEIAPDEIDPPAPAEEGEDTTGRRFRIPIVVPEGVPSGDRRQFAEGALEAKECPMPLLWQRETDDGHKRSVTVGRIDKITRLESGGLGDAEGVFDTHADAQEAARQVRGRFLTGVSGDVDQFEAELSQSEGGEDSMLIKHGRLVAATLVAKPAFQEATIEMIPEEGDVPVITAAGGPMLPPKAWFFKPSLDGPTMLSVTEEGRIFGHIAEWGTPHLGNPQLKPPRSPSNYRYFNRKPVRTAEGEDVKVGQLTLVGGHAKMSYDPDRAVKHYDDTNSAIADVVAGEDEFGIWVAGAMRPGVTDTQLRAFRASEPSGDWRMRDGNLELCAVCQVNVAGFPVTPRALVASGEVVALVAAGMIGRESRQLDVQQTLAELQSEVAALRAERDQERRAALLATVESLRA